MPFLVTEEQQLYLEKNFEFRSSIIIWSAMDKILLIRLMNHLSD